MKKKETLEKEMNLKVTFRTFQVIKRAFKYCKLSEGWNICL